MTPFSKVPNAPDPSGWTPIQSAAISGYTEVIKILGPLSKKDPNSPDPEGWTPIQTAALKGHTDIVKILAPLSHKNPNSKNKTGFSPMYLAKQMGNNEIVSILKSFKWIEVIYLSSFRLLIVNIHLNNNFWIWNVYIYIK